MKALKPAQVRELIGFAEKGELDNVVGVLVRLDKDQLAELKAVLWLGKDGHTPKHWDALVIQARAKLDKDTVQFLAEEKNLGADLHKGMDMLENSGRI
ncbi:MAG TPA: DUF3775 domain-containing protein [Gammaproteobacteria bacterium]|jgi:hypothetical protein|nr:DUF3775 domain-containing protein [Gammaproteobacteria bacterium]